MSNPHNELIPIVLTIICALIILIIILAGGVELITQNLEYIAEGTAQAASFGNTLGIVIPIVIIVGYIILWYRIVKKEVEE